ncbi:DUF3157 family protein [Vibrio sp. JPW-9-11-11]|uniref:DUF3157 family protein n=1 Tax=Vibrio sp. JPW-9-11-11 TaxID=1416532 RepID=UPI0015945C63|nr:DUF3157 family protein [Vibrio sp. JPW-9-11-11]NVD05881.1 DUF3157 family protein [Vibrio sp. JPW-9-11-11]
MKITFGLSCLLLSGMACATQTITLDDGRQVQLHDDFTWQYVIEAQEKESNSTATIPVKPVATIPVINRQVDSVVTLGSQKPVMQLSDSGVDLLLRSAQYLSGQLVIETSLTNQSTQSVVLVDLELALMDMAGKVLATQTVSVWTSIKRLADTYLRPQQAVEGKTITWDVARAEQYQIKAKIIKVETR